MGEEQKESRRVKVKMAMIRAVLGEHSGREAITSDDQVMKADYYNKIEMKVTKVMELRRLHFHRNSVSFQITNMKTNFCNISYGHPSASMRY